MMSISMNAVLRTALFAVMLGIVLTGLAVPRTQAQESEGFRDRHQLWIAPQSLPLAPLHGDADFMDLFTPEAPWRQVAAHTKVFKLYAAYVNHAPQSQIDAVVADLNRRHIAIALEVGVMNVGTAKTNPPCGGEGIVEGYGIPAMASNVSRMIKSAGGRIQYIVMDEPVFYGHYYNGPHACHSTISEVVSLVTPTLQVFMQEFPDLVIGEVEPTSIAHREDWRADLRDWATGVIGVLRRPLAFMQLDIPWASKAQGVEPEDALAFYRYAQELRSVHLLDGIGIIHDGTPLDTTDASWVADARRHVQLLEGKYGLRPDQDIFQSWMANPTVALPESNPDTLTGLAQWYLSQHTRPRVQ